MNDIKEKIKKVLIAVSPVVASVAAVWGLDIAGIATATEAFLISVIQYAQFWVDYKASKTTAKKAGK